MIERDLQERSELITPTTSNAGFTAHFPSSGSAFRFLASPDFSVGAAGVGPVGTPDSAPAVPNASSALGAGTISGAGAVSFSLTPGGDTAGSALGGHQVISHNIFATSQSAPASPESNVPPGACRICQDKATGKHYGALSCDGCKGFFRRTIRKSQRYVCRYSKNCTIDKDKRNSCRYCRYRKCINAGMKREAVQNERDRISSRKVMGSAQENIDMLMAAEQVCLQLRSSVIHALPHHRQAGMGDLSESIKQQLLLLVEWAKNLPVFSRFEIREQVSLLRSYGSQHLLLGVARRSIKYDGRILMLGNESVLCRDQPTDFPDIQRLTGRILDELVQPMQELDLDDCEFVLLKAIMFFNPHAQTLKSKELVREMRQGFIGSLESYVQEKYPGNKGRLGSLYLMLPSLQLISHQMVESLQAATFFGVARLDKLLHEILLENEDSGDVTGAFLHASPSALARRYSGNATTAAPSLAMANGHCSSAPSSPSRAAVIPKDEYIPNGLYP